MTTGSKVSNNTKAARKRSPAKAASTSPQGKKKTISPVERWLLVRENAYVCSQKRGFVGGNPFEDWLNAEEEIDAKYDTDFQGMFSLTDPAEITEQFKSVFAVYGLDHLSVESILAQHRDGMEKLAALNRKLVDSTSELANQQTAVVREAVDEVMKVLRSAAECRMNTDWVTKQAELSMKTMENALSQVKALTESESEPPREAPSVPQGTRERKGDGDR
jgi:hypothetical protein